MHINAKLIKW